MDVNTKNRIQTKEAEACRKSQRDNFGKIDHTMEELEERERAAWAGEESDGE